MEVTKITDYVGGWVIGDFSPSILRTKDWELGIKLHKKHEYWAPHTHKVATEYNILISGKMTIQNKELVAGDVFVFQPGEASNPTFQEDCMVVTCKCPSVIGDKYEV